MSKNFANLLCFLFIGATIITAIVLYPTLPEQVPTHWNAAGNVDDCTQRSWAVGTLLSAPILAFLLMKIIPAISPKGYRTEEFIGVLHIFQVTIVGFASAIAVLVFLEAVGIDARINQMVFIGVGLLFFILGNYLGKVRKNFFMGIRTPWTLASDEVWNRTHRLGGWLFMAGGLFMIAAAFVAIPTRWLVGVILVVALFPVIWSYVLYRRIEGFAGDERRDN